ncbi:MAG TPA: BPSS1780 family membrane protein [Usitatibacter sp.]|jgi:uncharacterized membrane protein|nr:BPSS1780 family membrane protein [Usitatibacter sp.]
MSTTEMQDTPPPAEIDPDLRLVLPGRGLDAGAGWSWIVKGWELFTRAPLMWIVALIIVVVIAVAVSLLPIIGQILFQLAQGVIAGGFMVACRALEKGGEFELEHLFAGFSKRFVPLLLVGVFVLVGYIVIFLVFLAFAGVGLLGAFMTGDPELAISSGAASLGPILLGSLVMLALMVPLMAAYWFAPALVMMHDMKPLAAMKASFFACFKNFIPFLVYGLVMTVAAIVAIIPFGLGFLVWVPVAIASTYVAYRQIFTDE